MTDLRQHYDHLWRQSLAGFKRGEFVLDDRIAHPDDDRFGITLLFRLSPEVKEHIRYFLYELGIFEPRQYYYPETDLHVTVMSIISCYAGFSLAQIEVEQYVQVIREVLQDIPAFTIDFKGITASPSCIMLQGYPQDETLNTVRDRLREHFKATALEQSIDQRYTIQTAHSTVMRFREPMQQHYSFLALLQSYRRHRFGTFKVEQMELVFNDWYQRKESTKVLAKFDLAEKLPL